MYSEKWFSLVEVLSKNTSILVDVEKGFENVLLEQIVFVFNNAKTSSEYKTIKFNEGCFSVRAIIPTELIRKYRAWICDVTKSDIKIAEKITKDVAFLKDISYTTRGLPLQRKLKDSGDIPVIGGKELQRYAVFGVKGFLSKSNISSNKKTNNLLQPKIMSQNIIAHIENPKPHIKITSTVDIQGNILCVDTINNTFITEKAYSLHYVLALLNSQLISWYSYRFIYACAIRTMHFDNYYIGKIPLRPIPIYEQKPFIIIIDKILSITKDTDYPKNTYKQAQGKQYEKQIDQMIYELYGLTDEEIKIVEGETK